MMLLDKKYKTGMLLVLFSFYFALLVNTLFETINLFKLKFNDDAINFKFLFKLWFDVDHSSAFDEQIWRRDVGLQRQIRHERRVAQQRPVRRTAVRGPKHK